MSDLTQKLEKLTPDQLHKFAIKVCKAYLDPVHAAGACYCSECMFAIEKYGKLECINGISYRNTYNDPKMFCSYGKPKEGNTCQNNMQNQQPMKQSWKK